MTRLSLIGQSRRRLRASSLLALAGPMRVRRRQLGIAAAGQIQLTVRRTFRGKTAVCSQLAMTGRRPVPLTVNGSAGAIGSELSEPLPTLFDIGQGELRLGSNVLSPCGVR